MAMAAAVQSRMVRVPRATMTFAFNWPAQAAPSAVRPTADTPRPPTTAAQRCQVLGMNTP